MIYASFVPNSIGVFFFNNELVFDISFFCSPYFEVKHELDVKLQHQKQNVTDLHTAIKDAKIRYTKALGNLEKISEEIHQSRREKIMLMFPRQPGVGAESGSSLASAVPEINLGMLLGREGWGEYLKHIDISTFNISNIALTILGQINFLVLYRVNYFYLLRTRCFLSITLLSSMAVSSHHEH